MSRITRALQSFLGSSLFWGPLTSLGFYTLLHQRVLEGDFFQRYFTSHWVLYAETTLFFTGLADLLLRFFDVAEQRGRLRQPIWKEPLAETVTPEAVPGMLAQLDTWPERERGFHIARRLRDALVSIARHDSADQLDDELKYLSENDATRAQAGFALLRIVIWAIPILGFLGTVIGITNAIGNLNPEQLESSLDSVTMGLGVAFDTTALALSLSMILMFGQFLVDKLQGRLLHEVDQAATRELSGRFSRTSISRDPQVAVVQKIADQVLHASQELIQRQTDIWQRSIETAQLRWNEAAEKAQQHLESQLSRSLSRSLQNHAETLAKSEAELTARNRRGFSRVLHRLGDHTQALQQQHVEIVKQSEILLQVVEATGQVTKLEEALNRNLASLAGAQHFHDTLLSLSAAVNLLAARLGQVSPTPRLVELRDKPSGRAA